MSVKPTVGRIVHFYNQAFDGMSVGGAYGTAVVLNGQGAGPYPAIVIQSFPGGDYVNLKVMAWGGDWAEGSVSELVENTNMTRYWVWPPRD